MNKDQAALVTSNSSHEALLLVLDDDPTFLHDLKDQLEPQGWAVIATMEASKAIHYMDDLRPDCFITKLNMPLQNGVDIWPALQQKMRREFIPMMVLSGNADKSHRMESYKCGADDFMAKPLDIEEFVVRIERLIQRKREFQQVAMIDKLTGVYTRNYLKELLQRMETGLERGNEPYCIAVIDLDQFQQINDRYGHLEGDAVLERLGAVMRKNSRSQDLLIRYGGEEFIWLLPQTLLDTACSVMGQLKKAFSLEQFGESSAPFCVSFCAAVLQVSENGHPFDQLLRSADSALYRAKSLGPNKIECVSPDDVSAPSLKKLLVAVVDDDPIIRSMLLESLEELELSRFKLVIETFSDGRSFVDWLVTTEEPPSLVILDGVMPRLDGLEVLHKVRKMKWASHMHVIMLTGRKSERDLIRALELGADDYLTKLFSLGELQARIKRLLKRVR
jgi:two-component system cell cycle response regulator